MFQKLFVLVFLSFSLTFAAAAQTIAQSADKSDKKSNKPKKEKQEKQEKPKQEKIDFKNPTAEQLAEIVIVAHGGPYGRATLTTVRKTELERGELVRFAADGTTVSSRASYEKRIIRGENQEKDRIRLDQKLTEAQYALVYDKAKTYGLINSSVFVPREEADRAFQAQIFHNLDALLRYKENGSTLKLAEKDKQMGVELHHLDVTDKAGRTTRFNISAKLYRVLSLEYSEPLTANGAPVKFIRKFYDYRNAQGTNVPWRTTLYADGKVIEETNISTVTYGMKIDDAQFQQAE